MDLFSKMELITMASVLGGIILIILFLTILDIIDEKRSKKKEKLLNETETKQEEKKVEEVAVVKKEEVLPKVEVEEIEILDFDEPVIEMKKECNNEVIIDELDEVTYDVITFEEQQVNDEENSNILVITNEQERAKEELARLEEELQKEEEFSNTITNFEIEQEENAIISYDELIKISDKLYDQNENIQYDDGDEPITIDEVIKRFSNNEMVFENTANYEKLNKEIEKDTNLVSVYETE